MIGIFFDQSEKIESRQREIVCEVKNNIETLPKRERREIAAYIALLLSE